MTISELRSELDKLIEQGHGDALVLTDITGLDESEPNLGFNELMHTLYIE